MGCANSRVSASDNGTRKGAGYKFLRQFSEDRSVPAPAQRRISPSLARAVRTRGDLRPPGVSQRMALFAEPLLENRHRRVSGYAYPPWLARAIRDGPIRCARDPRTL